MSWGLRRETIVRVRPTTTTDVHGNTVEDFETGDRLPIPGCLFAPAGSTEILGGRDTVQSTATVYGPPDVDVVAEDAIEVRDRRYQVVGEPQQWRPGTVIALELWEG